MTDIAINNLRFFKTAERLPREQEELLCYHTRHITHAGKESSHTIAFIGILLDSVWCRDGIDEWIPCNPPTSWAYIPENPWS